MAGFVWVHPEDGGLRKSIPQADIRQVEDPGDGGGYRVYVNRGDNLFCMGRVYAWPPEPEGLVPCEGWTLLRFYPWDGENKEAGQPTETPILAWASDGSVGVAAVLLTGEHVRPENLISDDGETELCWKVLRNPRGVCWATDGSMTTEIVAVENLRVAADVWLESAGAYPVKEPPPFESGSASETPSLILHLIPHNGGSIH